MKPWLQLLALIGAAALLVAADGLFMLGLYASVAGTR